MRVLVTQSNSFLGKNLIENLKNIRDGKNRTRPNIAITEICENSCVNLDFVFILPGDIDENELQRIIDSNKYAKFVYISIFKDKDDEAAFLKKSDNCLIYKCPTITGKWQNDECEIAKLCKAVANDEVITVDNPNRMVELLFIDDFIDDMFDIMEGKVNRCDFPDVGTFSPDPTTPYDGFTPVDNENGKYCYSKKVIRTSIGNIVDHLREFNNMNESKIIPETPQHSLAHRLFSMYLSYLPENKMCYLLNMNVDNRGIFTELFKTKNNGQVSINIARPNNTRGQHWHNNKWEIFVVVSGHGLIQEREIGSDIVHSFEVRGEEMKAIIMLPGYAHCITNLEKDRDLVTVMFANEEFDASYPDTYFEQV